MKESIPKDGVFADEERQEDKNKTEMFRSSKVVLLRGVWVNRCFYTSVISVGYYFGSVHRNCWFEQTFNMDYTYVQTSNYTPPPSPQYSYMYI